MSIHFSFDRGYDWIIEAVEAFVAPSKTTFLQCVESVFGRRFFFVVQHLVFGNGLVIANHHIISIRSNPVTVNQNLELKSEIVEKQQGDSSFNLKWSIDNFSNLNWIIKWSNSSSRLQTTSKNFLIHIMHSYVALKFWQFSNNLNKSRHWWILFSTAGNWSIKTMCHKYLKNHENMQCFDWCFVRFPLLLKNVKLALKWWI